MKYALVDFSGIFRRHWHATEHEGTSGAYHRTIASVEQLESEFDSIVICCDHPPYWRSEVMEEYKANRPKADPSMVEQAKATLGHFEERGWPIVRVKSYEADDVIATLCKRLDSERVIVSGDKDLMQLVSDTNLVSQFDPVFNVRYDEAAVFDKLGVHPSCVVDYLALIGDKSDNVPGVYGIGKETAPKLLNEFGSMSKLVEAALADDERLKPAQRKNLVEANVTVGKALKVLRLADDVPVSNETMDHIKSGRTTRPKFDDGEQPDVASPEPKSEPKQEASSKHEAIVQHVPTQALSNAPLEFTSVQLQMIADTCAQGASTKEFQVLMEVAKAKRLNPLLKQIHFVKRWNRDLGRHVWSFQVAIDGFRAIANRTGMYAGQDEPVFTYDERTTPYPTTAKVPVYRKDWDRPAVGLVHWVEYMQTTKGGDLVSMWAGKPHTMLAKCAEAQAFRKAFPEDFCGLYIPDEMPDEG